MTSITQESIALTPTRQTIVHAMRRELWRHGIVTVDLDNDALYAVIQAATALMEVGGHALDNWAAWDRTITLARTTLDTGGGK